MPTAIHPLTLRLLRRMREPGAALTRNRAYRTFQSPEGRTALRLHRCLRGLERELESDRGAEVRLRDEGEIVVVHVERPQLKLVRTLRIERPVFALLMGSGPAAERLRRAAERDAPGLVRAPRGGRR